MQPVGLLVDSHNLTQAIPFALQRELDFLVLDSAAGLPGIAAELAGAPDLAIMNHAVRQLRA